MENLEGRITDYEITNMAEIIRKKMSKTFENMRKDDSQIQYSHLAVVNGAYAKDVGLQIKQYLLEKDSKFDIIVCTGRILRNSESVLVFDTEELYRRAKSKTHPGYLL